MTDEDIKNWLEVIKDGDHSFIQTMVERGADVNYVFEDNMTPMYIACMNDDTKTATELFKYGATSDTSNSEYIGQGKFANVSCLHIASSKEMVNLLLDNGADINTRDSVGRTPLMWQVKYKRQDLCRSYIEGGCDVNATDDDGCTALMLAASSSSLPIVQDLLAGGADIHMRDRDGFNSVDYAGSPERSECGAYMQARIDNAEMSKQLKEHVERPWDPSQMDGGKRLRELASCPVNEQSNGNHQDDTPRQKRRM